MNDKYKGRKIVVLTCGHCPLSRLMRIKDGPFCDHKATDGMNVGDYSSSIHPDCPLDIADAPMLAERVEELENEKVIVNEQFGIMTRAYEQSEEALQDSNRLGNKLAEQNEKMLAELKSRQLKCNIWLDYRSRNEGLVNNCISRKCNICDIIAEIEKEDA